MDYIVVLPQPLKAEASLSLEKPGRVGGPTHRDLSIKRGRPL